jgi:hypothetical protein
MAKLDAKQITIAYVGATGATVATGAVAAGLWNYAGGEASYVVWCGVPWLVVVGVPSVKVASDALMTTLGLKQTTKITINRNRNARSIPFTAAGSTKDLFMSVLPGVSLDGKKTVSPEPAVPDTFEVTRNGTEYEIPLPTVEDFLYAAWRRQRSGGAGISREYHTRTRRPALQETIYECIIILVGQARLIANRTRGRSGQLIFPPQESIQRLRLTYGLLA